MGRRNKREEWLKKYERLQGLKAFVEEHESMSEPDVEYIKGLYRKIRRLKLQLEVMSDVGNENVGVSSKSE